MNEKRTTRRSLASLQENRTPIDRSRFDQTTDAEIRAAIEGDPDTAPLLDEAWFASAQVSVPTAKVPISIRVDPEVLDWYKQNSERYQSKMNAVLRSYMEHEKAKRRA